MKIYAVRWRDGSVSVTLAKNRLHALEEFDKIADTNGLKIEEFDEFLATFKLTESGDIVLEDIDSDTRGEPVHSWAFPIWSESLETGSDHANAAKKELARDVRIAKKVPIDSEVRRIVKSLNMHPDLVEQYTRLKKKPHKKK
ncbi:MAG TPA: hypothetical protein VGK65_03755 [Candidatus Binatia bacterium]|jgi:hypothetical protein